MTTPGTLSVSVPPVVEPRERSVPARMTGAVPGVSNCASSAISVMSPPAAPLVLPLTSSTPPDDAFTRLPAARVSEPVVSKRIGPPPAKASDRLLVGSSSRLVHNPLVSITPSAVSTIAGVAEPTVSACAFCSPPAPVKTLLIVTLPAGLPSVPEIWVCAASRLICPPGASWTEESTKIVLLAATARLASPLPLSTEAGMSVVPARSGGIGVVVESEAASGTTSSPISAVVV